MRVLCYRQSRLANRPSSDITAGDEVPKRKAPEYQFATKIKQS
jgi:hypothetical protein